MKNYIVKMKEKNKNGTVTLKTLSEGNRWEESTNNRDPLVIAALIHSEVSEFVEEARVGAPAVYFNTPTGRVTSDDLAGEMNLKVGDVPQKPEGQLIELADVLIRMMDYCGRKGWDLEKAVKAKMDYNATRSHRHGGKLA